MKKYKITEHIFRFDLIGIEYDNNENWEIHHWENVVNYNNALKRKY